MLEAGIQGAPFQLPLLVRRTTLKKRSSVEANLAEQPSDDHDHDADDVEMEHPVMSSTQLRAVHADLESRMDKKVLLNPKKGVTTIRSRHARNLADASDDPSQFDGWIRPENEEDDSSDEDEEDDTAPAVATAAAAVPARPATRVSYDRVFCPVRQAGGAPCVANYKHGNGKSMQKHVYSHFPDGHATEAAQRWAQFVRDGKVWSQ